ncbi:hypothetical protein AAH994_01710 [Weeksellaceae bacterium A-14]
MNKIFLYFLLFMLQSMISMRAQVVFSEDFGTSEYPTSTNDFGRKPSSYMPSGSFGYGTSYVNTTNALAYKIDDNYYAVVAPGYIRAGINPNNSGTWWTPAYDQPNTVTDHSGNTNGAAMIINAGNTLAPFYERTVTIEENSFYKASLWIYIVNTPVRIAIDIKDLSGNVLTTLNTDALTDASYKGKWFEIPIYFKSNINCSSDRVRVVFRNDYSQTNGNDYYIDDLSLSEISQAEYEAANGPADPIPCPKTPCDAGDTAPTVNTNLLTFFDPATGANLSTATSATAPTGASLVWYNNANHLGTALSASQIANAPEGTYYAFFYDATYECFSPASAAVKVQKYCISPNENKGFNATNGQSTTFTLQPTDVGFQLDIYKIDNSLNIKVNGTLLTNLELDFQSNHSARTLRFKNPTNYYGAGGIPEIWNIAGNVTTPVLRIIIRKNGTVSFYGAKATGGALYELELFNGAGLNTYTWNTSTTNTIIIGQKVDGPTHISGRGIALQSMPCKCTVAGSTETGGNPTKVGITNQTKQAGWPENIPNGFVALESQKAGFVITRVNKVSDIADPKDGMIAYDIADKCVKLYRLVDTVNNMGEWQCIKQNCNQSK